MVRGLPPAWIVALATVLHAIGIARSHLPAQDGLKFLRVARAFQSQPWADVVRASDQHPLYPWCVAQVEPAVGLLLRDGPLAWTRAAQLVSALASLVALVGVYRLAWSLFDRRTALLASILFITLPGLVAIEHDTLSDALALCAFVWALGLGVRFVQFGRTVDALLFGLIAGAGYWTRPEAAVLPASLAGLLAVRTLALHHPQVTGHCCVFRALPARPASAAIGLAAFLAVVGSYALVKGEVSEKLALRCSAAISSTHDLARPSGHALPTGLDHPRWDFSPKEEAPVRRLDPSHAAAAIVNRWAESLGWVFAALAILGAMRVPSAPGRGLAALFALAFGLLLLRHVALLGYLSDRHVLCLTAATLPWAAAGTIAAAQHLAALRSWSPSAVALRRRLALACLIVVGLVANARTAHASRTSHQAAAQWLTAHAAPGDAVYDTRGWAAFLSGLNSYDAWHVRQALTDARLAFVVVGDDELRASSPRAATLRALLHHAAVPVACFGQPSSREDLVRVYRFQRPASWEAMTP
jgi:hypothetical protein